MDYQEWMDPKRQVEEALGSACVLLFSEKQHTGRQPYRMKDGPFPSRVLSMLQQKWAPRMLLRKWAVRLQQIEMS